MISSHTEIKTGKPPYKLGLFPQHEWACHLTILAPFGKFRGYPYLLSFHFSPDISSAFLGEIEHCLPLVISNQGPRKKQPCWFLPWEQSWVCSAPRAPAVLSMSAPVLMDCFHLYPERGSGGRLLFLDKSTCILSKLALRVTSLAGQTVCVSLGQTE